MRNARDQRLEEIFAAACELDDAAERRAYLNRVCAGEPVLRAEIEALLDGLPEAERFFHAGATAVPAVPLEGAFSRDTCDPAFTRSATAPGEEPIGTRIGRYKLAQKLGEGGCGVVYLAEQEEPVRRRVALKIIKLGMETKSVIARFEAERQALAMMDHPNIARVFDAGATDRGPPYFVMELVQGVRITTYCDQHELGLGERLDLFVRVCHAIQHAHQKGIIHGDIKPSNIMVALHDGTPVPKVIDFGISKATEARLSERWWLTAQGQLIGTPAYMSPEQGDLAGRDIDTRSDIYSLGVLLYELLVGATPFDAKALVAGGVDAMRRTLREVEPPRPSAKFAALPRAEAERVAAARRVSPARLSALLAGDLDWIVMKALEKDRARRYETANGLAMDIQRHRHNEPVMARPPSRLYRLKKLVRRNRAVFVGGGAVAAALVAGFGTSTWLLFKEREARHRAVAAEQQQVRLRHEAERREKLTQAAFLVTQERFVEADKLLHDVELGSPTVEGAAVFRALGEWHALHGRWREAAARFATVLRVDQLDGVDGTTLDYLRRGPALIEIGDTIGYERFREEAIARYAGVATPFADRIVKISLLLPANPRTTAALQPLAGAMAKSLADANAAGDGFMVAWRALSFALWEYRRGNFADAAEWCRRCLDYRNYNNAPRTATAEIVLAMTLHEIGRDDEARDLLRRAAVIIEAKFEQRLDRGTPIQGFWFDWAFARVLLREAQALVDMPPRE